MYRRALIRLSIACVTVMAVLIGVSLTESAQVTQQQPQVVPPVYNPYPLGILPADLGSEIARVRREVNVIFQRAITESRTLPPLVRSNTQGTGNPPTLQGTGYEAVQVLGKLLNYDENMSPFRNRACAFCHLPYAGFSGP